MTQQPFPADVLINRLDAVHVYFKLYIASFLILLGINSALFAGLLGLITVEGDAVDARLFMARVIAVCGVITGAVYSAGVVPQYWISRRIHAQVQWARASLAHLQCQPSAIRQCPLPSPLLLHVTTTGILVFSVATLLVWIEIYRRSGALIVEV